MIRLPGGVINGGQNVIAHEERVILQDFLKGSAGAEEFQDVRDPDALAADAGAAAALLGVDGDSVG